MYVKRVTSEAQIGTTGGQKGLSLIQNLALVIQRLTFCNFVAQGIKVITQEDDVSGIKDRVCSSESYSTAHRATSVAQWVTPLLMSKFSVDIAASDRKSNPLRKLQI
jgi:hypothetical protein